MKKFLFIFLTIFTLSAASCTAQVQWFRTTQMAIKYKTYTGWTDWTDWRPCVCSVKIDLTNDIVTIYSNRTQVYKVIGVETPPADSSGTQVKFRVKDQDGDYGSMRLRVENNGNSQIYIDFADVMWVYNVIKTQ